MINIRFAYFSFEQPFSAVLFA